tara:strand:+ start:672 stop:905 length:234 start_codon:yes stop_codon:yes gene_type:complete
MATFKKFDRLTSAEKYVKSIGGDRNSHLITRFPDEKTYRVYTQKEFKKTPLSKEVSKIQGLKHGGLAKRGYGIARRG